MDSIVWMILLLYEVESMFYMNEVKEKVKFNKLLIWVDFMYKPLSHFRTNPSLTRFRTLVSF
jgi:hypothetical protein